MGSWNSLPNKIPRPNTSGRTALEKLGITVEDTTRDYCKYTLPTGWKMVDYSQHYHETQCSTYLEYHHYLVVDHQHLIRVEFTPSIDWSSGSPKYDNTRMLMHTFKDDALAYYVPRPSSSLHTTGQYDPPCA